MAFLGDALLLEHLGHGHQDDPAIQREAAMVDIPDVAQISFATNLLGQCEEEHAGGAIVFPSYDLGEDFRLSQHLAIVDHTFSEALTQLGERVDLQPGGWARDREYADICYVPQDAFFDLRAQTITWEKSSTEAAGSKKQTIKLVPRHTYVLPSGYKVEMVKPEDGRRWRLRPVA
jgi:hypothetical protein